MKLAIVSIFTLGILFAFLLSIILGVLYFLGKLDLLFSIIFTGIIFFLQWLISPYFSDIIYRWFYKLKWISFEDLERGDMEVAEFIKKTCNKYKIKIPKIGFIDDNNPQIFCYGSAAFNARIVFTSGIFTYLNTEERKAVFGHELGHIVHRDFIIMTIAAFLLSLLYHISQALFKSIRNTSQAPSRGSRSNRGGIAIILGVVSYIFYLIGTYILLWLSRTREYYADEFSAKETNNTDALASALIKIAYGIIARPEEKKQRELMHGTRTLGIMDFKAAKGIGLAYINGLKLRSWEPIEKILLFDLKNPWAFIYELGSSHPLTAKRIKRLEKVKNVTMFDFERIDKKYPIDTKLLHANFLRDIFFIFLPPIFILTSFSLIILLSFLNLVTLPFTLPQLIILLFVGVGIMIILKTTYLYPEEEPKKTNLLELMGDVYASPIRGKAVEIDGEIVGRGIPGLILSEDMMLQDDTGLVYLNYEGIFPLFSNLVFALFKLDKLIGQKVKIRGWFVRDLAPRISLKEIVVEGKIIKSRARTLGIISGIIMILLSLILFIVFYYFKVF
ncbi:MAG: zinc metalloprotease HtpX [Candidatus Aenigmatarchaeota archaeon]